MSKHRKRARYGRDAPALRSDPVQNAPAGAVFTLADPATWKVLCGDGYRPITQCPEVQICVNIYADLIASMTLRLMRNTDRGDVREKNQLSRLLDISPNRRMTHMTFFQVLVRALMESGNQITFPVYRDGYLAELVPLRPMELTGIVSYINTRSAGGVMAFAISAALYCATGLLIGAAGSWLDRKVRILR